MASATAVRIGVSACLLGQEVRYDGGHKRDAFLTDVLARFVQWVPVCPEEDAGFGTPREAMRLERTGDEVRLVTVRDATRRDRPAGTAADRRVKQLAKLDLDGYVLKKDSPSCGLQGVKVYDRRRCRRTNGARALRRRPDACASDAPSRRRGPLAGSANQEQFLVRVFAYARQAVPDELLLRAESCSLNSSATYRTTP